MKEKILEGKVAVVAGSGQGIGRSIALGLGEAGAEVITNNRWPGSTGNAMLTEEQYGQLSEKDKQWYDLVQKQFTGDAETTAQMIRENGGEASACFADISDFQEAELLIRRAVETYGKIDILINVAGTFGICDIDQISEELWDKVNNIKPKGYFNTMRFAIPYMKQQRYGRIINCTSRAFMGDVIKHAEYCAANAGVVGLTRGAAIELREYGITCNAFGPFAKTRAAYEMEAISRVSGNSILYLASAFSEKISGSVFTLSGNAIQMHQEPVVAKMMVKESDAPWSIEEIIREAPRCILKDYHSIADI